MDGCGAPELSIRDELSAAERIYQILDSTMHVRGDAYRSQSQWWGCRLPMSSCAFQSVRTEQVSLQGAGQLDSLVETQSFQLVSIRMSQRWNIPVSMTDVVFCGTTMLWFTDTGTDDL